VLTLVGQNTFQSVTFNNIGGTATPTVTGGTLFVTGAITATNDNYATTPTFASILELNGQNQTVTVTGSSPMGLILSGAVQNAMNSVTPAGLIKAGSSSLVLTAANTFAGGVQLNAGTLIIGAASSPTGVGVGLTAGPLGTGALTIAAGTTLQPDTTARTIANNLVVNGNFTVGGAATALTLNGAVNLGGSARAINVLSPQVTTTFAGIISGSAGGLTKAGNGTLVLAPTTTGALNATGAASAATTTGSADLTLNAAVASAIVAGMPVHGPGIAPGTTVASVAGSVITLSQAAVANGNAGTFAFGTTRTLVPSTGSSGANTLTVGIAEAAGILVGSAVTGVGLPATTLVSAVDTATGVVTLDKALTANVAGQNIVFGGATAVASANTYAGTTTVSGGLLRLGNIGALPAGSAVSVLSGGTLDINGLNISIASLAGDTATTGGLITNSPLGGAVTLTIGDATNSAFGGAITNNVGSPLNLTKQGSGTLTLTGPNSYSGATTVANGSIILTGVGAISASGALNLSGASAVFNPSGITRSSLTIGSLAGVAGSSVTLDGKTLVAGADGTNTTFGGVISGAAAVLTKQGGGTLTLSGTSTYGGGTNLAAGLIQVEAGGALGSGSLAHNGIRLNIAGGQTLPNDITLGTNSGQAGRGLVESTGTGLATLSGAITITAGPAAGGHFAQTVAGSGLHIAGPITSTVPVSHRLGNVTYSGGGAGYADFTIGAGTASLGANNGLATSALVAIGTAAAANLDLAGYNQSLVGIEKGGFAGVIGNSSTIADSTLTLTGTSSFGGIIQNTLGSGTGTTALTVSGGSVTLTAANTYTGATTISSGSLILTGTGRLSASTPLNLSGAGAVFNPSGITAGSLTVGSLAGVAGSSVSLGAKGLVVGGDNTTSTFAGVISGATGSLSKAGTGTLILTGASTFGGGTTISAGTLQLGNGGTSGSIAAGDVANSGTFAISRSDDLTFASKITGAGAFTKLGAGNLTLSGANDFTGATLVSAGTLTAASGALSATSGITVNGAIFSAVNYNLAATLALDASATATISAADLNISGAITNAGTTADALNFSASTGKITLTSLAGTGKTRFGGAADITGGIAEGTVTVVGALGANITGGNITAGSLAGAVSGGTVTVTNLLTGNVSAGTVTAGSLSGNVSGGALTVTGALTGNVTAGTVTAGSMTGNVGSSVTVTNLLTGEITAGTNSLGSLSSASVTGGTNTITGAATVTTVNGGTTTVSGVATITTLTDGTLNLNGATASIGTLTAGTVNLGTTALTVDSGTFSGSLAGSGSLIKATSGILTLTGPNLSFTGATTINAGELIIQNVGALGTSAVTINGGTLDLNYALIGAVSNVIISNGGTITGGPTTATVTTTGSTSVTSVLTGTGGLTKTGAGELSLTTPNFFTGGITANDANAVISAAYLADNSSSLGASALNDPTKLVLGNGATLEFTGTTATTTSRSFTVNGSAALAVDAAAAPLTFSSSSIMALDPADSTPDLKLTAFNAGVNRFEAQLSADDIANNRGLANLAIDGTGKWVLGGSANRFKGDVRVDIGGGATLGFESGSLGMGSTYASSDIVVANGSRLAWSGTNTDDISSRLSVPAGATAKLDLGSNNVTFAAAPDMGAGASLQKEGSGKLNIAAAVNAPTLNVAVASGTLSVNGTLGAITLTSGATLGGAGTIASANVVSGAILSPGNSPGTLNATSLTFVGGSYFDWQVQDATDLTNGFDKIILSGSLDLRGADANNRVKFRITSLQADGITIGDPLNFNGPGIAARPTTIQFGTVATGGNGVLLNSGLNISDVFEFQVGNFTFSNGDPSNAAQWSIDWNVDTGAISLTAVPEPSTYGFAMGALALAAAAIRRRKRQATKA
jgi:autotransporter-associated beta strand protein